MSAKAGKDQGLHGDSKIEILGADMTKVVEPRDIRPVSEQAEASVAVDTGRDESCGHILNIDINVSPDQLG